MNNDGEFSSIAARGEHLEAQSAGFKDASFASTSDRNILEWFLDEIGSYGQWGSSGGQGK